MLQGDLERRANGRANGRINESSPCARIVRQ